MGRKMELMNLKSLHVLDGGELEKDFNEQLASLVKDCTTRPGIDKARELTVKLKIVPDKQSDGTCEAVIVDCQTTSKCPNRPIRAYRMNATMNGGLKFNPDSPLDPNQGTLDLDDE